MSFADGFTVLVLLSALYYAWFIGFAYRGLRTLARGPAPSDVTKRVSVLVPARNEEQNIGRCLTALSAQDYPSALLEVIVIDDGSDDATAEVVRRHAERDPRIHLLQLDHERRSTPSTKRGRKPEALAAALRSATGEAIITTDADCVAPTTWVRTMVGHLQNRVVYAVGPVLEEPGTNVLTRLRALEVLGGMAITAGRIAMGRPINGHGGNTVFAKEIYERTGGFDLSAVKSDEETMMHRIVNERLGGVWFAGSPDATVRTSSPASVGGFWNQRMRWGSMHRHFADTTILTQLALLYLSILVPIVGLVVGTTEPTILAASLFALLTKVSVDYLTLSSGARLFGETVQVGVVLLGECFHSLYIIVFGAVAQFARYRWKDRTVLAFKPSATSRSGS